MPGLRALCAIAFEAFRGASVAPSEASPEERISQSRRTFTLGLLAAAPLFATDRLPRLSRLMLENQSLADVRSADSRTRAMVGYDCLNSSLYEPATSLYRFSDQRVSENGGYAYSWPFSAALMLVGDMRRLTGDDRYTADFRDRLKGLDRYRDTRPLSPSLNELGNPFLADETDYVRYGSGLRPTAQIRVPMSNDYFDDNAFYALSLLSMYAETGDAALVETTRKIFNYGLKGVHATHASAPGGIVWIEQKDQAAARDITANTNLAFGLVAARLYEVTANPAYLGHARALYGWTNRYLCGRGGLPADRIGSAGLVDDDASRWSYVSGLLIGLGALLFRITGETNYLSDARSTNDRATAFFTMGSLVQGQSPGFNSIYFRMRLLLASVTGDEALLTSIRSEMAAYADAMWASAEFDSDCGLFRLKGSPEQVLEHSAMVQIAAMLAMAPSHYASLI